MLARQLHGEQVVTGGDPRPAHVHDLGRARPANQLGELVLQCGRLLEAAVAEQIELVGAVDGTRNVSGHRVDGFDLATETAARARIDQRHLPILKQSGQRMRADGQRRVGHQFRRRLARRRDLARLQRQARLAPGGDAAVQQPGVAQAEIAHQPPQAGSQRAALGIVGDRLQARLPTRAREECTERPRQRQGVPARLCRHAPGQVVIEVRIDGARNM